MSLLKPKVGLMVYFLWELARCIWLSNRAVIKH